MPEVDLVVNTFDRTVDTVLAPGYFDMVAAEHRYDFTHRTALINNVTDLPAAVDRARQLVDTGEITRYLIVAEHLDAGLAATGLRRRDFGRHLHISDCVLVAVTAPGPDWVCHVDAEARLRTPAAWIPQALDAMDDRRYFAGSPQWEHPSGVGNTARIEAEHVDGGIATVYGFGDQTFLTRRSDCQTRLAHRPIWLRAPGALWHPSHSGYFLETIIEAHMRITRRPRAVVLAASTVLAATNAYHPQNLRERAARKRNRIMSKVVAARDWKSPAWREPLPRGVDPHRRF